MLWSYLGQVIRGELSHPVQGMTSSSVILRAPQARDSAETRRPLDAESRAWWSRLHAAEPIRRQAITELHERLRREARFHIHGRTGGLAEFPRSDIDDLAVQAADDALMVLLRKLEDYRGDSQFWTWARRFAQIEAPVSIRRRLGHDPLGLADPERLLAAVPDPACSCEDRVEMRQLLKQVSGLIVGQLTERQRTVVIAIAINGESTNTLASELDTTPGAIYKALHDARAKLKTSLHSDSAPAPEELPLRFSA
ncbi:MAG: RNA polymerase sigma factor [Solirubrobacteraceae bacterium]